jgi:uncharacterized protein
MFARNFIDSLDFARKGRELCGEIAVADMPRLRELLVSHQGAVKYSLRGMVGRDGNPALELELVGSCQLRCQRCLDEMTYPIKLASRLLLVPEDEFDEFSGDENEVDSIAADSNLDVQEMIEEEILLSLPFAPRHPDGVCQHVAEKLYSTEKNPFGVLSVLKMKNH